MYNNDKFEFVDSQFTMWTASIIINSSTAGNTWSWPTYLNNITIYMSKFNLGSYCRLKFR